MADLHQTFIDFIDKIKLQPNDKKQLKRSKDTIRKDIKNYFKKKNSQYKVRFLGQGSYSMHTTIIPKDGDYDIDDGVYIFGNIDDKPTCQQVHSWINNAVKNRTNQNNISKNTCIRVQYANNYHIDLPIYYKIDGEDDKVKLDDKDIPKFAHKKDGWIDSDPYAFRLWFEEKSKDKPQLKRIVRYLKAWSDNKSSLNLPSGMVFTILASENYMSDERDDVALLKTLERIQKSIDDSRSKRAKYTCFRPTVDKTENLLEKYSSKTTKENFLTALNNFINSGEKAINLRGKKDACAKWQKHLGDRFPCSSIKENDSDIAKEFAIADSIKTENKSA